jgi:ATP-dependent protease HslVU (ClpYQ) peptidase subunit
MEDVKLEELEEFRTILKKLVEYQKKVYEERDYMDLETIHMVADELLCKVLVLYGEEELVDLFRSLKKWYA